jgi:L-iditol 2-dehydrogenase
LKLGATEVILSGRGVDTLDAVVNRFGGKIMKPRLGKRVVIGGADRTYDCVGSRTSLVDSLRLTREGGRVILVGVPGNAGGVEWPIAFLKELKVQGTYIYDHAEEYNGDRWKTFDLAIALLDDSGLDLSWMVTHRFSIEEFGQAIRLQSARASQEMIKSVFDFRIAN